MMTISQEDEGGGTVRASGDILNKGSRRSTLTVERK